MHTKTLYRTTSVIDDEPIHLHFELGAGRSPEEIPKMWTLVPVEVGMAAFEEAVGRLAAIETVQRTGNLTDPGWHAWGSIYGFEASER